ncbi:MAG: ABC transporter permease [Planctomycetota bacterium]
MAMTDGTIVARSLGSRLFSTATTVVTVAVAVGLMLTLLSMRDSSRRAFERGAGSTQLLISRDASPLVSVLNGIFYANPPADDLTLAEYNTIASLPNEFAIPTQLGDSFRGLPVLATTAEFFSRFVPAFDPDTGASTPWVVAEGRVFDRPFEVVLGARAAKGTGLVVGDEISLYHGFPRSRRAAATDGGGDDPHVHDEYRYRVVGILEATGTPHDRALFTDLPSSWVLHAHDRRRDAAPIEERASLTTTVDDITDDDKRITGVLYRAPSRGGGLGGSSAFIFTVRDELQKRDPSLTIAEPSNEVRGLFEIVGDIDQILVAMSAVVMLSSAIGIMLALYNSMEQRRRQIAILRVLGFARGRVFGLVVTESAVIGAAGAVIGVGLALLGTNAVADVLKAELGLVIEPVFTPRWTMLVAMSSVAMSSVAGVVPALVAYRTPVAQHLKPLG